MTGRSSSVPNEPDPRQRLADLMDERRQELDKLWQDVARDGGISLKALHTARTGESGIRPLTRRSIEKGLHWERMSVDRILEGGDPEPLQVPVLTAVPDADSDASIHSIMGRVFTDRLERMIWDTATLPEAERLERIEELRAKRAELAAELERRDRNHGTGLTALST